ncbi:MAG: NAD(P)H-nitrite reductase [Subtercola sp.]|nr:NAD(P)H-nitrite reductase [Subtercola sp.]
MSPERPVRVVLIGYGPVGARFVEGMLPAVLAGRVTLTVIGAEPDDAYNRVLLAEYAVGRSSRERLGTTDTEAALQAGAVIRLGESAVSIDRLRQTVRLDTGDRVPYDRLVCATGARANIPTLDGLQKSKRNRLTTLTSAATLDQGAEPLPAGVVALRDLNDANVILAAVHKGSRIVVLGAGVLGMELALALSEQGADVVAVYHGPIPMARNLDEGGGRVLSRAARTAGVVMVPHARAEGVLLRTPDDGPSRFDAILCADGKQIQGDLLVLSCGVSARTELAAGADLRVSAGILVDEELRSWSDPDVFAIGDCAHVLAPDGHPIEVHVTGAPSGLIGPGWRQADWLARKLSGESSDPLPAERSGIVMLKAESIDVVSGGDYTADLWNTESEVTQWLDPARGAYLKMVTSNNVLTGFLAVGLPLVGAELCLLFERGDEPPADRTALLRLDSSESATGSSSDPLAPEATICWCNGVTAQKITDAAESGHHDVECIGKATRAGTGCGSCKGKITEILARATASGNGPPRR